MEPFNLLGSFFFKLHAVHETWRCWDSNVVGSDHLTWWATSHCPNPQTS